MIAARKHIGSMSVRARLSLFCVLLVVPSIFVLAIASAYPTGSSLAWLSILLFYTAIVYVVTEERVFGGINFCSCFLLVSGFVFSSRGLYIAVAEDFSIIGGFGLPATWDVPIDTIRWVIFGHLFYMTGATVYRSKTIRALRRMKTPQFSQRVEASRFPVYVWLLMQLCLAGPLVPLGLMRGRTVLTDTSENAYVYLLPTLIHGFNLYATVAIALRAREKRNAGAMLLLLISLAIVFIDAFLMHNLSQFRGFYLVGLLATSVGLLVVYRGVSTWAMCALFCLYPIFKTAGSDRSLDNQEMMYRLFTNGGESYSQVGLERAFGEASDVNMLDTFAASLNWQHAYRGYVLSYLYPLVHFVPRRFWPSKPEGGVLSDTGYTLGMPYSPGIIGFFNDDGGVLYMLIMMAVLGAFMRYWEFLCLKIRDRTLQVCTFSAFFISSIVTVRYLPYQVFYGFLVFFVPCLLCHGMSTFAARYSVRKKGRMYSSKRKKMETSLYQDRYR